MELRALRYFLAVAREENITRAAALLHMTQPTLSRQLMQLEEECSFRHFTGVNFPLLLEVLSRRMSQDLASAIVGLDEVARRSIYDCDAFLSQIAL